MAMTSTQTPSKKFVHLFDYFFICGLDCDLGLEPYIVSGDEENFEERVLPPLHRIYKAKVLQHFPESVPGFAFDSDSVSSMCMPNGLTLRTQRQLQYENLPISGHNFIITLDDAGRYYGATLSWFEEITNVGVREGVLALQAMFSADVQSTTISATGGEGGNVLSTSWNDNDFFTENDRLYARKAIGILSRYPFAACYNSWLLDLWCLVQQKRLLNPPMNCRQWVYVAEKQVKYVLSQLCVPLPGHVVAFPGPCARLHYARSPDLDKSEFPIIDYPLRGLLEILGLENVIKLFTSVLLEYRVILLSEDCRLLMLVAEGITGLLFPFTWASAYCPILPRAARNIIDAPLPFILGLLKDVDNDAQVSLASEAQVCIVDIEKNTVHCGDDLPCLPYAMELRNEITQALVLVSNCTPIISISSSTSLPVSNSIPDVVATNTPTTSPTNASRSHRMVSEAGVGLIWPTPSSSSTTTTTAAAAASSFQQNEDYQRYIRMHYANYLLQEVFLNHFLHLFFDYESFLIRRKASDLVANNNNGQNINSSTNNNTTTTNVSSGGASASAAAVVAAAAAAATAANIAGGGFDKLGFLSDQPSTHLGFLSAFLETQMFVNFIDVKLLSQWDSTGSDQALALFDSRLKDRKQQWAQEAWRINTDLMNKYTNKDELKLTNSATAVAMAGGKTFWTYRSALDNVITADEFVKRCECETYLLHMDLNCDEEKENYHNHGSTNHAFQSQQQQQQHISNYLFDGDFICGEFPTLEAPNLRTFESRGACLANEGFPVYPPLQNHSVRTPRPHHKDIRENRRRIARPTKVIDVKSVSDVRTTLNFVDLLLQECKAKTKRMVVEKMGQEAIALGHGNISVSGVEENTLVTGLCDLLERIWSHETNHKTGKSALWTHLTSYVDKQLSQRRHPRPPKLMVPPPVQCSGSIGEPIMIAKRSSALPTRVITKSRDSVLLPDKAIHVGGGGGGRMTPMRAFPGETIATETPPMSLRYDIYSSLPRQSGTIATTGGGGGGVSRKDYLRSSNPTSPLHHSRSHVDSVMNERVTESLHRRRLSTSAGTAPKMMDSRPGQVMAMLANMNAPSLGNSSNRILGNESANIGGCNSVDTALVWEVFGSPKRSLAEDVIAVKKIPQIQSEVAYARAFVRLALEKKLLHAHLESLLSDQGLLRELYKRMAFLRSSEECEQFLYHLLALNAVDYNSFTHIYTSVVISYRVYIYSGRRFSGGGSSSANAWFSLSGVHCSTGKQAIPRGLQKFEFDHVNLGSLTTLRIGHDGSGMTPNWFIEFILVQNTLSGHVFKFPCTRWIGKSMEDGSLERLLIGEQLKLTDDDGNVVPYSEPRGRRLVSHGSRSSLNGVGVAGGYSTPPSSRSPSMSRRGSTDTRLIANSIGAQTMIQEQLGHAVNCLVKYFLQPIREQQQASLTMLLCGNDAGLVPTMELVMNHGLIRSGFFQKRIFVWDYLKRIAEHESERHTSASAMQLSRYVNSIDLNCPTLGKDGKLQRWICLGIRDCCLSDWIVDLQISMITAQMYEEKSFLRDLHLGEFVVSLLDMLKEFQFSMEPSLIGEE